MVCVCVLCVWCAKPNVVAKWKCGRRCAANSYGMFVHLIVKDIYQSPSMLARDNIPNSWPCTVNGHSSESEMHAVHINRNVCSIRERMLHKITIEY